MISWSGFTPCSCRFLAADFDGESWARDAVAYLETCRIGGISAALERSRSGKGGHVWIGFAERIPAREARQLGAMLITATMERRPEIGFASYDRLFPSQDTMPAGGFGNLIALPTTNGPSCRRFAAWSFEISMAIFGSPNSGSSRWRMRSSKASFLAPN